MLLGVISDTHDRLASADTALELLHDRGVRTVIHCGDWIKMETFEHIISRAAGMGMVVHGVLGNNDMRDGPRQTGEIFGLLARLPHGQHVVGGVFELRVAGKAIAVYHGHHKPTLSRLLQNPDYDTVFLGHSHKPRDERLAVVRGDGSLAQIHVINPGSTAFSIPRRRDWRPSTVVYDTVSDTAEFLDYDPVR